MNKKFTIVTDSSCDVSREELSKWGVPCVNLKITGNGQNIDPNMPASLFYQMMKDGVVFMTSGANPEAYKEVFEKELKNNKDVIYIGFSGNLSVTLNSARIAAEELQDRYKKRKIEIIDTLSGCGGLALLVHLAVSKVAKGASFEEVVQYVKETSPSVVGVFSLDDLVYVKRGGRISTALSVAASVLDIKPIFHVSDDGTLETIKKVKGRRRALDALVDSYLENAIDPEHGNYYICQGDCMDDANYIENKIVEKCNRKAVAITDVGMVIGSHGGPGTISIFYLGKKR